MLKEFNTEYNFDKRDLTSTGIGSGVHLNKDVKIDFSLVDRVGSYVGDFKNHKYFDYMVFDIADKDGNIILKDYMSGKSNIISISEKENESIFGKYEKDFGIYARLHDKTSDIVNCGFLALYGNHLEISNIKAIDHQGTHMFESPGESIKNTTKEIYDDIHEEILLDIKYLNKRSYTAYSHLDIFHYYGDELNKMNFVFHSRYGLGDMDKIIYETEFNQHEKLWLKLKPYSKVGQGQEWIIGPFEKEYIEDSYDENLYSDQITKEGNIKDLTQEDLCVVDRMFVDPSLSPLERARIDENDSFYHYTIPLNEDGTWAKTTFNYLIEFKNPDDCYNSITKKVTLTATGSSKEEFNEGMPLFKMVDENKDETDLLDLSLLYCESGVSLACNSDHEFTKYKFHRVSL